MDKESILELQKLDCNCNDCIHQIRDNDRFKESLEQHKGWQLDYFNTLKNNLLKKAEWWKNKKNPKYNHEKGENLKKDAFKMRFQFDKKKASINYGYCDKFNKKISWLPNTLQLHTQECFIHRKES